MAATYWWMLGAVLVVLEMATGTFYLLILGVAALLTGVLAWWGVAEMWQWLLAAGFASVASLCVPALRCRLQHQAHNKSLSHLDAGQAVVVVSVAPLRVKYRGAEWSADGIDDAQPGQTLYIVEVRANVLRVTAKTA
jgi:membrane protein implicated in regulation of membrane protease activity